MGHVCSPILEKVTVISPLFAPNLSISYKNSPGEFEETYRRAIDPSQLPGKNMKAPRAPQKGLYSPA